MTKLIAGGSAVTSSVTSGLVPVFLTRLLRRALFFVRRAIPGDEADPGGVRGHVRDLVLRTDVARP